MPFRWILDLTSPLPAILAWGLVAVFTTTLTRVARGRWSAGVLFVSGLVMVAAGVMASRGFVERIMSPDHVIGAVTRTETAVLQVLLISVGGMVLAYATLRAISPAVRKIEGLITFHRAALAGVFAGVLLLSVPFMIYAALRIPYLLPIDLNEGWNVFHTTRFMSGGPLYLPLADLPVTPLNYPPLAYLMIGGLARFTGNVLLTGRIVALAALLCVGYLVYATARSLGLQRALAVLCAVFWFVIVGQQAEHYVAMFDPEILGRVFSLAALCLYFKWRDDLTPRKGYVLAGLVVAGLFVKHLLVVVPITLVVALFAENRRAFRAFVLGTSSLVVVLFAGTWAYAGHEFLANFVELDRPQSAARMAGAPGLGLFPKGGLAALLLPTLVLLIVRRKVPLPVLVYFAVSFVVGLIAVRGSGVDVNAWFDFFVAVALTVGLLAASLPTMAGRRQLVASLVLFGTLWPLSARLEPNLGRLLDYRDLRRQEAAFRRDIEFLRSIPGPAIFQERLMGFYAGKDFLFDTTAGSWLIASGRVPKEVLLPRIRERFFSVVVLNSDLRARRARRSEWMQAVDENYLLVNPGHESKYFFYMPAPVRDSRAPASMERARTKTIRTGRSCGSSRRRVAPAPADSAESSRRGIDGQWAGVVG